MAQTVNQVKTKQTSITPSISLSLGLLYQLNNRFLLSANILNLVNSSYNFNDTKTYPSGNTTYTSKGNAFNLNAGLKGFNLYGVSFGFKYLLKK